MTRTCSILQHVPWEGPGLIAAEAEARGFGTHIHRMDLGATVLDADGLDCLVVMGGPMGAYEADLHPFLAAECSLLADMVRRDRPVLGVCLGAQLLAWALGAKVFPGHGPEIGFGSVELTAEGERDPILGPAGPSIPVFHWHGDTFDLPEGATLVASSANYPHQAFRYGSCAYGLQFHVEPDAGTWQAWREHLPAGSLEHSETRRHAIDAAGRGIIARFIERASS